MHWQLVYLPISARTISKIITRKRLFVTFAKKGKRRHQFTRDRIKRSPKVTALDTQRWIVWWYTLMESDTTSCAVLISIPSLPMSKSYYSFEHPSINDLSGVPEAFTIQSIPCRLTMAVSFSMCFSYLEEHHTSTTIYPKSPKINGVVERFNRTLQEEFINRNDEIYVDLDAFAEKLTGYLRWVNGTRPHGAQLPVATAIYTNTFSWKYVPIATSWPGAWSISTLNIVVFSSLAMLKKYSTAILFVGFLVFIGITAVSGGSYPQDYF